MQYASKVSLMVLAALGTAIFLAAIVSADPDDPCASTFIRVCRFIPILPDLDHNIDLSRCGRPGPARMADADLGAEGR
jgi:hypothetical protein